MPHPGGVAAKAEPEPTVRPGSQWADSIRGMADRPFLTSAKFHEQQKRAVREGAHPDIVEFEKRMIKRMAGLGVPMFGHCVIRSVEQQEREFAEGDSKVRFGPHNVGCAIDLVHSVKAWSLTRLQWEVVGHVGNEVIAQAGLSIVSLAWGGDWKFYDPAHWEIDGWRSVQTRYPWPYATNTQQLAYLRKAEKAAARSA